MSTSPLTKRARAKLTALAEHAEETQTMLRDVVRRIGEIQKALNYNDSDGDRVRDYTEEIRRLEAVRATRAKKFQELSIIVTSCQDFIRRIPTNVTFTDAPKLKVPLRKDETPLTAVIRLRDEIAALRVELHRIRNAAPTPAEVRRMIRKHVLDLINQARPSLKIDHDGVEARFESNGFTPKVNIRAVIAWTIGEDAMVEKLVDEYKRLPKPALELTRSEKAEKEAAIRDQMDTLARMEEQLIVTAAEDGQEILRRHDADPAVVLGIVQTVKAKAAA